MKEHDKYIRELFQLLCSYKVQPLELRDYLAEHMTVRALSERTLLYRKNQAVTSAIYVASGCVAVFSSKDQVLGLAGKGAILAGYSFTSQQPSEFDLVGLPDSLLLEISFEHMKVIYQRFPATEELARLIMADVNRLELERINLLKRDSEFVVLDFYLAFPQFLPPGKLMLDIEIASYLLISESGLRAARSKLRNEEKLRY